MKIAVFRNPNVTSKHVNMALRDSNPNVLLAALESPVATDIQIARGIRILETDFDMKKGEIKDLLETSITGYRKTGIRNDKNTERVLRFLNKQ